MLDIPAGGARQCHIPDEVAPIGGLAPCVAKSPIAETISSKSGWGGARANSGGVRANSGGARIGAGRPRNLPTQSEPFDILRWYCVHTNYGADLTADIEIRLAGFVLFAPTIWKAATPMRRDASGSVRPAKPDRIVPMFPRHMFVRFSLADPEWRLIRALPGVDCIYSGAAGFAGMPVAVPDAAIELIYKLPGFAPNGCLYPSEFDGTPLDEVPIDIAVQLVAGPMADLRGICKWSDGQRVKLLLEIMGRPVLVTVPRRNVIAAE